MVEEIEFFVDPRLEQDNDLWSAYCDELRLASTGATRDEAEQNLKQTLAALARALRKRGTLQEGLDKAGLRWRAIQTEGLRVVA